MQRKLPIFHFSGNASVELDFRQGVTKLEEFIMRQFCNAGGNYG